MRTVKAVIGSSLVMSMLAASAMGGQPRTHMLRGDFAFTGGTVCVNSGANFATTPPTPPLGFDDNFVPRGPTFVNTNSVQGIFTFNGDGTGSAVLRFVSLGNPGAGSVTEATNPFTYSVAADGTLTLDNGPSFATTVAGPSAGQQSTVSGVPTFVGRLSSDRKSLTLATFTPAVETITRTVPAPEVVTTLRICHRNRVGIRINRDPRSGWQGED